MCNGVKGINPKISLDEITINKVIYSLLPGNKKTHEQRKDEAIMRKQKQRAELKVKYDDDEYKKKHAKEIAEARSKRKQLDLGGN
jgi:hypothetical protein